VTVRIRPATFTVPVRAALLLAATSNRTWPFPTPVAPLRTVIHDAPDVVTHAQAAFIDTVTAGAAPPAAGIASEVGLIDAAQPAA
jgi:hypothetical protein